MLIQGEEYAISPEVWETFENWYGDKAYRQASMVETLEVAVRRAVMREQDRATCPRCNTGDHDPCGEHWPA